MLTTSTTAVADATAPSTLPTALDALPATGGSVPTAVGTSTVFGASTAVLGLAVLLLAAAALCWPPGPGRRRLVRPESRRAGAGRRPPGLAAAAVGAAGAGFALAGPGLAIAAALAVTTALSRRRARRADVRALTEITDLASAVGMLAAELRVGAHPAAAAERAATDVGAAAAGVLTAVAATARLSGDVAAALVSCAAARPALAQPLDQLASGWRLAQRHGIPLADVLDAVRADLDQRVRARRRLRALLAGPRATASMLAGLPVLGLALGHVVGARPWHVLTDGLGQVLLVVGTALACGGLAWSARLTARAAS